jgi:hypothetical protein
MRDSADGKVSWPDLFVMFVVPVTIGVASTVACFVIPDEHVGTLVSVFSIFAGLLLNVLVLIYSVSDQLGQTADKGVRDRLLRESFANISYSIVVSLLVVALLTALLFLGGLAQQIITGLIVAFAANFGLSLLMILKRLHVLLRSKFPNA